MGKVAREQVCPELAELRRFSSGLSKLTSFRRRLVPMKLLASNSRSRGMQRKKLLASNSALIRIETVAAHGVGKGGSGA